jgi:hypothetical protein
MLVKGNFEQPSSKNLSWILFWKGDILNASESQIETSKMSIIDHILKSYETMRNALFEKHLHCVTVELQGYWTLFSMFSEIDSKFVVPYGFQSYIQIFRYK